MDLAKKVLQIQESGLTKRCDDLFDKVLALDSLTKAMLLARLYGATQVTEPEFLIEVVERFLSTLPESAA